MTGKDSQKVLVVFGTRPEAVKMAPVVRACRARPELEVKVCVTAQHRQMLDQTMEIFGLKADFDLDLMAPNQTLGDITCRVLKGMEGVFDERRPDIVLVKGDTTTVMASALAAFYRRIAVGHVEAGLRTGDIHSPWPEEMNRLIAGNLASQHYAPNDARVFGFVAERLLDVWLEQSGVSYVEFPVRNLEGQHWPTKIARFLARKIRGGVRETS